MPSLTRRRLLTGVAAAALAPSFGPAIAAPPFHRGAAPAASGTPLTTFQLTETASAPSLGAKRIGMVFRTADSVTGTPNDVPAGHRVRITRGGVTVPAQFDSRATLNGALQTCTACLFDAPFSAGETRTYTVVSDVGAFDNSTTGTVADITGASDLKVIFDTIVGSTSGSLADLAASFNTHVAVPTRVMQYEFGRWCDTWYVWGMAGSNGHLQVEWYVSNWKDGSGNSIGIEFTAVQAQQWWSAPFGGIKEKLTYNATLMNGATTIQSYANVAHCYMAQWATVRMQNDDQHATRHWVGANRPTLIYKPDQAYWIATGMVPPLALGIAYSSSYINTYTPGGSMSHRADVPGTGGYIGRGIICDPDVKAFVNPTTANIRRARASAFAGLSIPKHRRSNRMRQRSGDATSDIANTMVPMPIKDDLGTIWADYTADGLPISVQAYIGASSPGNDGYIAPTGGSTSGATIWFNMDDYAHVVPYSYFMYLYEGERYFMMATLSHLMGSQHAQSGGVFMNTSNYWNNNTNPVPAHAMYPGATNLQWDGIVLRYFHPQISRAEAWMANCLACTTIVPNNDPHYNYYAKQREINGKFIQRDYTIVAGIASDNGAWSPNFYCSAPWMDTWNAQGLYTLYARTKDINFLQMAHHQTIFPAHWVNSGLTYGVITFHGTGRPDLTHEWNATTNDWFPGGKWYLNLEQATIDSATGYITVAFAALNYFAVKAGDEVIVVNDNGHSTLPGIPIPDELTLGTVYYAANPIGATKFQLADNPDGTGLRSFGQDYTGMSFGFRLQDFATPPPTQAWYAGDSFLMYHYATVMFGKRHGSPHITDAVVNAFKSGTNIASAPTAISVWNYSDTL